jgi:hypothetical protein
MIHKNHCHSLEYQIEHKTLRIALKKTEEASTHNTLRSIRIYSTLTPAVSHGNYISILDNIFYETRKL